MRAVFCTSSLIVALAALVGAGRLWADGKDERPAKAAPRTRVALVNLTYVIKKYGKYERFQEEIKELIAPYQERKAKLLAQAALQSKAKAKSSIVPAKSENIEEKLKSIQREMEDNEAKAKKVLGEKHDEEMTRIYAEIEEATKRYAGAHGIDLVMHYNDAISEEDLMSAPNIARKLQSAALMPIYAAPGVDISKELVKILNARLQNKD